MWNRITNRLSGLFLKASGIKNCSGEYTGILKSSYDDFTDSHEVRLKIVHKFNVIEIRLDTDTSISRSVTASLRQDGDRTEIIYTYENQGSVEIGLKRHIGTGMLTIEGQTVSGIYYTHPDRGTSGTLEFTLEMK